MPESKTIFPSRLKEARKRSELSQAELARLIEVGPGTVGHLETGHQSPTFDVLCRLAATLETPLDWLAGFDSPAEREIPRWLTNLLPDLAVLDRHGQEAVKALVKGLAKKD